MKNSLRRKLADKLMIESDSNSELAAAKNRILRNQTDVTLPYGVAKNFKILEEVEEKKEVKRLRCMIY